MNLQRVGNVNFTGAVLIKDTPENIGNLRWQLPENLTEIPKVKDDFNLSRSDYSITKIREQILSDGSKKDIVILATGRDTEKVAEYTELRKRLDSIDERKTTLKPSEKLKWNQLLDDILETSPLKKRSDDIFNELKKMSGNRCWSTSEIIEAIKTKAFDALDLAFTEMKKVKV